MFRVKICGITSPQDAAMAADAGADAIGVNFFRGSPRYVESPEARQILMALPNKLTTVAVFVNSPADEVNAIVQELGFDMVQLHGDESPALASRICVPVIRAWRFRGETGPIEDWHRAAQSMGANVTGILIDAYCPDVYGGTGAVADWRAVVTIAMKMPEVPLILAGGLTPGNVRQAIRSARPHGVDVASGVESEKRRKNADLVREFVRIASDTLNEIDRNGGNV